MSAPILAWMDNRRAAMLALVQELVSANTENPPGRSLDICGRSLVAAISQLGREAELAPSS